ncbi:MAG: peptidoglycan-associated lipoprotein Pal, partial [bacterium]
AFLLLAGVFMSACTTTTPKEEPVATTPTEQPTQVTEYKPAEKPMVAEPAKPQMAVVELGDVYFAFDMYSLSAEARATLADNADILLANPGTMITIEGHCDERGTEEYNLGLGERRAASAKNYLVSLGVSASRIKTISYGEERPFQWGHNEDAWSQNRLAHSVVR